MPLLPDDQRQLRAAEGYATLGMYLDANRRSYRHLQMNQRLTSPMTPMQSRFRHLLLIICAFLFPVTPSPAETQPHAPIAVAVPGKQIQLPAADWTAIRNEESYAKNFESRHKAKNEVMEQVVTVFLIEMSPDRRIGTKISDTEYVEFFTVHPNSVTVQVRREKKGYWILSRQTFAEPRSVQKANSYQ